MTNFLAYMLGVVVVICGLGYGAHLLGAGERWVGIGVAVGIGLGVMTAIIRTRRPQY